MHEPSLSCHFREASFLCYLYMLYSGRQLLNSISFGALISRMDSLLALLRLCYLEWEPRYIHFAICACWETLWHFVSLVVGMLACDRGKLRWNQADLHKLVAVSMRIVLTFIISYVSCGSQHYKLVWPIASGSTTGYFVWLFAGISWQINICLYSHPLGGWEVLLLVFAYSWLLFMVEMVWYFEWQKFMTAPSSLFSEHYLPLHLQLHRTSSRQISTQPHHYHECATCWSLLLLPNICSAWSNIFTSLMHKCKCATFQPHLCPAFTHHPLHTLTHPQLPVIIRNPISQDFSQGWVVFVRLGC